MGTTVPRVPGDRVWGGRSEAFVACEILRRKEENSKRRILDFAVPVEDKAAETKTRLPLV